MSFAAATGVERLGENLYRGMIHPGWDIMDIANGGYIMAIAARAISGEVGDRELVSMTGYFVNPGRAGPVTIATHPVKTGSSFTTVRAEVTAGDRPLVSVLAAYAAPGRPQASGRIMDAAPPLLPPPEECVRAVPSATAPLPPPIMGKVGVYLHPDDANALQGVPSGMARIRGWFRLNEGEPEDPLAPVLAADAFPPAVFNANLPLNWTPTLDLTVHIRDPRPHTWLRCEFRTRFVTGGLLEEDSELWDEEGNLVAQSRQLALVPR